jgi:hypothetical protein
VKEGAGRSKLGRADRILVKLMTQFQTDIPDALRDHLPAFLSPSRAAAPPVGVLLAVFICQCRLKSPTVQVQFDDIRCGECALGQVGEEELVDDARTRDTNRTLPFSGWMRGYYDAAAHAFRSHWHLWTIVQTAHCLAFWALLELIRGQVQTCLDETSKQLVSETRMSIPAEPGQVERHVYEYERQGVCSLFMCFEPLSGKRHVTVSAHRTKQDFARVLRDLVDVHYPDAEKIVLLLDNLNTHDFSALYDTFEPEEAWRIREKIEIHYTPKHGSWLNMAEIELAVLNGQCLDRRIGEEETLRQEIAAWEDERNAQQVRVNWRFTTQDARIKLKRLYPVLEHVGAEI